MSPDQPRRPAQPRPGPNFRPAGPLASSPGEAQLPPLQAPAMPRPRDLAPSRNDRPRPSTSPRSPAARSTPPSPCRRSRSGRPGYHPFVYRKMVIGPVGPVRPRDGDMVRVVDRDGLPLGFGLWNARSQINLRLLATGVEAPGPAFWEGRIDQAIALRRDLLKLDESTDAYRVIHAEADGLSGLILDRFDDVLSAEIFSLGIYQRIGPILDRVAERLGTRHFRVNVDERIALAEDFPGKPVSHGQAPAAGDDHRERRPVPRPVPGQPQDRLLLRPARQPPGPDPVHPRPDHARRLLLHRRLRPLRDGQRRGDRGDLRRPRREGHRPGQGERQRQPGPADLRPLRRLRLHEADGRQRQDLRRGRARPAQADPRPARHLRAASGSTSTSTSWP